MTSHGITVRNLLRTLPEALRADENMYALASAIAKVLAEHDKEVDKVRVYPQIENQPEPLLDILANDFKVDWYGYNYPLHVKKGQFRDSFRVRRKLGTPGAMEVALRDLYPGSDVEEWFEYGGDPYFFRVIVDVTNQRIDIDHTDGIVRTIMMFKNKRSHLQDDTVIYRSRTHIEIEVTTGYVIYNVRLCGTYPVRATQGGISRSEVVVLTGADGVPYTVPLAGEIEAGTHPSRATQGGIGDENIVLLTDSDGVAYAVPTVGTRPERAMQGSAEKNGIEVGDDGSGFAYRAKLCGSTLGSLI